MTMISETQTTYETSVEVPELFTRVLVGVDQSPESVAAARQAARLTGAAGTLTLLGAWPVPSPTIGVVAPGFSNPIDPDVCSKPAEEAVAVAELAIAAMTRPGTRVVSGVAWEVLMEEAARTHATLVAVGSHGQGRLRGILIGSTATEIVHKAPCSVLVARPSDDDFPRRIVVGVDGSPRSAAAYAVARELASRFDGELWPVVAHGGDDVDREAVNAIVGYRREDLPDEPVRALVAASTDADLVVVGSRGLHGRKALGSVSERVAHRAHASVLIVR
jgi:nucleotide-binding universal stress UspA family protein